MVLHQLSEAKKSAVFAKKLNLHCISQSWASLYQHPQQQRIHKHHKSSRFTSIESRIRLIIDDVACVAHVVILLQASHQVPQQVQRERA